MNGTHVVFVDEHVELADGNTQVGLIELVRDVPADRSESSTLLDNGVEETQSVQQLLEGRLQHNANITVNTTPTYLSQNKVTVPFKSNAPISVTHNSFVIKN